MSESREHKRRYNARLLFIADWDKWYSQRPPMLRIIKWVNWVKAEPTWGDYYRGDE